MDDEMKPQAIPDVLLSGDEAKQNILRLVQGKTHWLFILHPGSAFKKHIALAMKALYQGAPAGDRLVWNLQGEEGIVQVVAMAKSRATFAQLRDALEWSEFPSEWDDSFDILVPAKTPQIASHWSNWFSEFLSYRPAPVMYDPEIHDQMPATQPAGMVGGQAIPAAFVKMWPWQNNWHIKYPWCRLVLWRFEIPGQHLSYMLCAEVRDDVGRISQTLIETQVYGPGDDPEQLGMVNVQRAENLYKELLAGPPSRN